MHVEGLIVSINLILRLYKSMINLFNFFKNSLEIFAWLNYGSIRSVTIINQCTLCRYIQINN